MRMVVKTGPALHNPGMRHTGGMKPLISADDLRARLEGGEQVTVLDVRYRMGGPCGPGAYAEGHVPSAAYVDLDADLAAPPGGTQGGRHPLPDPARFAAAMRRCAVSAHRPVVVYDDWPVLVAAAPPRAPGRPSAGRRLGRVGRRRRVDRDPGPRAGTG